MPRKKGPPYENDPGCQYIVVDDPWPGDAQGKERLKTGLFNWAAVWLSWMFEPHVLPEQVFYINTVRVTTCVLLVYTV